MEMNFKAKKPPLVILTGPTSVGKTALSISLAKALNGEIISADSMQVYKGMDIGTAKITPEEMQGVKHYLIDELSPTEEFNIVLFQSLAKQYINEIYQKGKLPILVGGTGFYIQSVLYDIEFSKHEGDTTYREELEALAALKGSEYLHELLRQVDEKSAELIHPNNTKRIIRALEYYKQTNENISNHNEEQSRRDAAYRFCYFVLNKNRSTLYETINERVDLMVKQGLLEEVKKLREMGLTSDLVSMQGIGYRQVLAYLDGEYDFSTCVELIKRDTRHFAKRQITWFKREKDVIWVNKDDFVNNVEIIRFMLEKYNERI